MLLAALIALWPTLVTAPPPDAGTIRRNPALINAAAPSVRAGVRPLGEQPPAQLLKAVVREIDGCNVPIVVAARVGTPKR